MDRFHIHQIYYDDASRSQLDPGFIPLDNSNSPHSDWYEFWAIRKYLLTHELQEGHWYGFLSPKFASKTGLTSQQVFNFLSHADSQGADVGLALCYYREIAFYWNCFEQGDRIHPGLVDTTIEWLKESGFSSDIRQIVNHTGNFTYCNFIFGKKKYWTAWLKLAETLFAVAEGKSSTLKDQLNSRTRHAGKLQSVPMKVFIQERIPSILLSIPSHGFRIATTESSSNHNIPPTQDLTLHYSHAFMAVLNQLKLWYDLRRDIVYSNEFFQLRKLFIEAPPKH